MAFVDPLSDMLARIRNAQRAHQSGVITPASKLRINVLNVFKREGYISDYKIMNVRSGIAAIHIDLKYVDGQSVIREIGRISKPGRRVYSKIAALQKVYNGLGISVLSTPLGVLSDHEARQANVGGEVLCQVF